ncbi:MAG: hypothetical protein JGK17_07805 [Microcoleus sp. PH2017_10_PVI_O_A]|uniref:hypothetical protein n=1 Tax=unclassified Microcoleus TaxID=2642155 RepID=UPI001D4D051F|nr:MULTISPECIES: hypothetical protein [unclassified Microcoleus]TAE95724.1 MAG: hypothetical protein EAZ79_17675 [Oscillatoriales cyanobacterium]MCC3405486.1 hypothetical protein [Microcoleus sp. PH2017_10_PVI_O_A]MCC3461691.1 hypothetical protein [Microcoleus sp. PH2017_11_PCY_U_A]MCC3477588.1 hypothetical protein [Microcoleus sp. PH2017_12_PCY_D_A]MCC3528989.1 hypothetical protein [Microcoleus sp. PH2017_21_RUC_O_A]
MAGVKMQVIGGVMRKLVHLAFGVFKSQKPFDPNYAIALLDLSRQYLQNFGIVFVQRTPTYDQLI